MHEILPIAGGLLVGSLLPFVRPSLRLAVGAAAAVAIGVLATVVSGEFRIGWEFLAIDIPGTAVAIAVGYVLARTARARRGTVGARARRL